MEVEFLVLQYQLSLCRIIEKGYLSDNVLNSHQFFRNSFQLCSSNSFIRLLKFIIIIFLQVLFIPQLLHQYSNIFGTEHPIRLDFEVEFFEAALEGARGDAEQLGELQAGDGLGRQLDVHNHS